MLPVGSAASKMTWFQVSCVFLLLQFSYEPAAATVIITKPDPPDYYTAALFEHNRKGNWTTDTPSQIINMNLDYYQRATEVAKSKGADIIIFPEYGIVPFLSREEMKGYLEEVPEVKVNPCILEREFASRPMMYRLSCMARHNRIVVVANTGDIQPCTKENNPNCPDDGTFHLNGNVAFDRDGTLLAKYHKEHLFYEIGMDLPQKPQDPVFKTDFGTFAMYVSFDLNWKPIVDIAQREDIDNIILPAMWLDLLPTWSALQLFQAWALGNNITLLVANVNIPGFTAVGSGVFTAHMGVLKHTFNPDGSSKLVISRVPRSKHQTYPFPNVDSDIYVIKVNNSGSYDEDEDGSGIPEYCSDKSHMEVEDINSEYRCLYENTANYTFVKLTKNQDKVEACNNGMCCTLEYSAENMNETYYLGVLNGTYELYVRYFYCKEICLVVRCEDAGNKTCAVFPQKASTVFHEMELRSNFTTKSVYPSVLKTNSRLARMYEWTHGVSDGDEIEGYLKYKSVSQQPLLVAALNGRCYDRDPPYKR